MEHIEQLAKSTNTTCMMRMKRVNLATISLLLLPLLSGCGPKAPCPTTPEEAAIEQVERQRMVRDALEETSPRYMNNLPKAVSEFCTTLPCRRCPPPPAAAPAPTKATIIETTE